MGLKKGHTNNLSGRPKGSRNKASGQLRELILIFLEGNFEAVKKDFQSLPPKDRLKFYSDLLSYGVPKLQSIDLPNEFEKLSDQDIDKLIEKIAKAQTK